MRKNKEFALVVLLSIFLVILSINLVNSNICVLSPDGTTKCDSTDIYSSSIQPPPLSGGITSFEPPVIEKTQEQRDCEKTGCFFERKCYILGYIKNGTYCSEKGKNYGGLYKPGFLNQSETGANCTQDYECKTNICSDTVCLNMTKQKQEIESLRNELINLSLKDNESENTTGEMISNNEIKPELSLLDKIINFFKNLFGNNLLIIFL